MSLMAVEIRHLPEEVLRLIFSKLTARVILTSVIDVCKQWRAIIEDDASFWNNLQLTINCDNFIKTRCFGRTRSLREILQEKDDIYIGEEDLQKVRKVRCLKISGGSSALHQPALLAIRVLDIFRRTCKDLEKLEVFCCFGATSIDFLQFLNEAYKNICEIKFGTTSIWRIPYEKLGIFKNLNTLITFDYRVRSSDIIRIAEDCEVLSSLWILYARSIKSDDMIYFLEKRRETLKELGVGFSISDNVLERIKDCNHLKVLFCYDSRYISETGLNHLNGLSNLKYISLQRGKFNPEHLTAWVSSSRILSKLTILDLTDYSFKDKSDDIIKICPCPVTFDNNFSNVITRSRFEKSKFHWMYYYVSECLHNDPSLCFTSLCIVFDNVVDVVIDD